MCSSPFSLAIFINNQIAIRAQFEEQWSVTSLPVVRSRSHLRSHLHCTEVYPTVTLFQLLFREVELTSLHDSQDFSPSLQTG